MRPFNPDAAGTVNINVSAASQRVQLYPEAGPIDVLIVNDGTATVWVSHGDVTITASLSTGYPVRAGETKLLRLDNASLNSALYVAAIAAGATGKIYFTPGRGETH